MSVGIGADTTRPWELTGEKPLEYEARKTREEFYRKSQYPPMVIEPFPTHRSRVLQMTPEDRARRARWIKDQAIHAEDVQPAVIPRNFFRRIYHKPLDVVFNALKPFLGKKTPVARKASGHFLALWLGFTVFYYDSVYTCRPDQLWESLYGPNILKHRTPLYGEDAKNYKPKEPNEFASRGFSQRKVLKDMKTSFNSPLSS